MNAPYQPHLHRTRRSSMLRHAGLSLLSIGAVVAAVTPVLGQASSPPVVMELGPLVPPPAPTPRPAERKRIVSVITVQNSRDGESLVSFEASDFADEGGGKTRPLASRTYSLVDEEEPKGRELRAKIVRDIRALERDMLEYVKVIGPPKERAPLGPGQAAPGGTRPYR